MHLDKRLNSCVIKDHAQASCFTLLCFALLMKTVNYKVIKTMSKAKQNKARSISKVKALLALALLCFASLN